MTKNIQVPTLYVNGGLKARVTEFTCTREIRVDPNIYIYISIFIMMKISNFMLCT